MTRLGSCVFLTIFLCIFLSKMGKIWMEVLHMLGKKGWNMKKLVEFLEKKNFYVMVVLCVGIVIFSGLFVTSKNIISSIGFENDSFFGEQAGDEFATIDPESQNVSNPIEENNLGISGNIDPQKDQKETSIEKNPLQGMNANDKTVEANTNNVPDKEKLAIAGTNTSHLGTKENINTKKNSTKPVSNLSEESQAKESVKEKVIFSSPVIGKISFDYSLSLPVYSKTLNEWRVHEGIDIHAPLGTPVKNVMAGVIKEVKTDPRYGYTVVVEHEKGLKTIYASMVQQKLLVPNQKAVEGEILGSVGNTAAFEALEVPHVHFEVMKDGKYVDPKIYLPTLQKE